MKNIKTKSILKRAARSDGLRICVMRRIHPEYDFDMWMPKLAPPEKLLQKYVINKTMNWKEFSEKYINQVVIKNKKLIELIVEISRKRKITLLCTETSVRYCHRYHILKECEKILQGGKNIFK